MLLNNDKDWIKNMKFVIGQSFDIYYLNENKFKTYEKWMKFIQENYDTDLKTIYDDTIELYDNGFYNDYDIFYDYDLKSKMNLINEIKMLKN